MQSPEEDSDQYQVGGQDGEDDSGSHVPGTVPGASQHSEIALLSSRLQAVEEQTAEFNRRSAHREAVIDRLHEENQQLRRGLGRTVLEPVVVDLLRFYDTLCREAARLHREEAGDRTARLVQSLVDDVELVLDRCGLEIFTAAPGEPFEVGRHVAAEVVHTDRPDSDNTVAEVLAVGVQERDTGRVRRPLRARFYRLEQIAPAGRAGPEETVPKAAPPAHRNN